VSDHFKINKYIIYTDWKGLKSWCISNNNLPDAQQIIYPLSTRDSFGLVGIFIDQSEEAVN
jgi:hypothetical protein